MSIKQDFMIINEVMDFLSLHGSEQTKKVLIRHGAKEPFFGVKVADLTKIQKKVKHDHDLALKLYETGNSDAMYLAGLICDPSKFDKETLNNWAAKAYWYYLSDYTVAPVTALSDFTFDLALEWIDSGSEFVESAGWATLSFYLSHSYPDKAQLQLLKQLLERAGTTLQNSSNRVRYSMNGFIIACGSFEKELNQSALKVAAAIGKVNVDMGGTACKVPDATLYIKKVLDLGKLGVKRKK